MNSTYNLKSSEKTKTNFKINVQSKWYHEGSSLPIENQEQVEHKNMDEELLWQNWLG